MSKTKLFFLVVVCLCISYQLFSMSMFKKSKKTNIYNYTVITGKMSSIVEAKEFEMKVRLLDNAEVIKWLKDITDNVLESYHVKPDELSEIIVKKFGGKKSKVDTELLNAKTIYKYNVQSYAPQWINEWMVISREILNIDDKIDEITHEIEEATAPSEAVAPAPNEDVPPAEERQEN